MKWAPSAELPQDPNSNAILFLDELPSAPPSTQAAAYQLVLNKRIGEYILPENVDIVAAGNRASDRGVVYKMPSPLANRFVHLELKVDVDEWINWALNTGLHKDVVGYISHQKQDLFTFDPKSGRCVSKYQKETVKIMGTPTKYNKEGRRIYDESAYPANEWT